MAVRSLKNSTLENFANYSSSMNAGYSFQDYELIESVFLASTTASVTFSNLNQYAAEYRHLQIRAVTRDSGSAPGPGGLWLRFNGDSGSNYAWHRVYGSASALPSDGGSSTTRILAGINVSGGSASNAFGPAVVDLLDLYASKNKTIRNLSGANTSSSPTIQLGSGVWLSTGSVSSLELTTDNSFTTGSRFSLYGIR